MQTHTILNRPLMTEKATTLSDKLNQVVFEVHPDANKFQIRDAVESIYGVKVLDVRTLVTHGKLKRRGSSIGRRPNCKKALVTLKKGETIDFYGQE